jgi:hypothetical protein
MLTSLLRDNDGDATTPQQSIEFNVNLSKLTFKNLGNDEITIDAALPTGVTLPDPNITNQEAMTIDSITSTGGLGRGLRILTTHTGGTATITNFNHDGGTTSGAAMEFNNYAATANVNTSKLTGGAGDGVEIDGGSTGTLTFATTVQFDSIHGRSVFISNNTGGTATFAGDITATPDAPNNAIELTNNPGQTIQFLGNLDLTTPAGGGEAFTATGGGTLLVTGTTNSLTTIDNTALEITGMTLSAGAGATFKNVNAGDATNGPASGIILTDNTGGPITVGDVTAMAGDTGSIRNATGDAIIISDSANATINGMKIDHPMTAGTSGVHVTKSTTATSTVNLGNMEIDAGATGIQITGGGTTAGALTMTVNDANINGPTATGIDINDLDTGPVAFTNTKVDGMNATATAGVNIVNSNAAITFDSASKVQGIAASGTAFVVDGGSAGTITYNGAITSTASADVEVKNRTGGTVQFSTSTSTITDTGGKGINIHDNTAGSVLVQGTNMLTPVANSNGVTLTNNTGASVTLAGLKINATGTGNGLVASGGGTVEVDGSTNTIDAVTGKGLSLVDMTIGNGGVSFQKVNVTAGTTNGIKLQNLTGGQVTIGSSVGAANSGGTLTTAAEAVLITDAQNVDLNHVHIASGATQGVSLTQDTSATTLMDITMNDLLLDAATGTGINAVANSTNAFTVRLENSTVNDNVLLTGTGAGTFGLLVDKSNVTSSGTTNAFDIELSGASRLANLVIRNGSTFITGDANSLLLNSGGPTVKTVDLLVDGTASFNTFTNTSATNFAANFISGGTTTLNATIQGNTFDNMTTPAVDFNMATAAGSARAFVNLGGTVGNEANTATPGGVTGIFTLDNTAAGTFTIFNKTATLGDTMNSGHVNPVPNAAAFLDNTTTPPPTPPIP